jgi:hypothetical protein
MFAISEETLREWWDELTEPARRALAADPEAPVPREFVAELMDLQGSVMLIPFRQLGNGAMSYLLPSRARAFVTDAMPASSYRGASTLAV